MLMGDFGQNTRLQDCFQRISNPKGYFPESAGFGVECYFTKEGDRFHYHWTKTEQEETGVGKRITEQT